MFGRGDFVITKVGSFSAAGIENLMARAEAAEYALAAAETRLTSAQEAIASAMTSLATGPGRDGYAYSVLDAWLADTPKQDGQ